MNMASKGITFIESPAKLDPVLNVGSILHILCLQGSLSFLFFNTHYNTAKFDYVILPDASLVSQITASGDFKGIIMLLDQKFVSSIAIRSNYGIIGHLSLLQNPVMRLDEHDFKNCRTDLLRLKEKTYKHDHLFYTEMLSSLLCAHILDLYDIHAKSRKISALSERKAVILKKFIDLLYSGSFINHRNLSFYAQKLFISEHYLSEICKEISCKPASYWIDLFTVKEIVRYLCQKQLTLSQIAEKLNFSSLSYFCRYFRAKTGLSPNAYRSSIYLL